jgi:hypothetical protein
VTIDVVCGDSVTVVIWFGDSVTEWISVVGIV